VRRRAHGALARSARRRARPRRRPARGGRRLAPRPAGRAQGTATRAFLEGSAGGRAWARVVADELRDLAGDRLPELPDEAPRRRRPPPRRPPPPRRARRRGRGRRPTPATSAPRASSRLGGALLLGGLAIVASRSSSSSSCATAATTTPRRRRPRARRPRSRRRRSRRRSTSSRRQPQDLKALGVVLVQRAQNQDQIVAAVQGLPKPKSGGYGIWLYSGPGKAQWLGFFASQDDQGRLLARGQLKTAIAGYREVLVTRRGEGQPDRPGSIYLRGPIKTASNTGG
jgi:hypothetical protein